MIGALFFILIRTFQLVTLIPILGMLAYFVHGYQISNQLTPNYILVLFIVSVLAAAWCLATVLKIGSVRRDAFFVAFVDLLFLGALIGGVYELRGIAGADCSNVSGGFSASGNAGDGSIGGSITYNGFSVTVDKVCAMLKAAFALAIIDILLFAVSAGIVALMKRREKDAYVEKRVYRTSSHGSRRGHTSHSHRSRSHSSRRHYNV